MTAQRRVHHPVVHHALRAIDKWYAIQVELHGQYSLARLSAFHEYNQRTPFWKAFLIVLATPCLAIGLVTLTDCMPLEDPTRGLAHSSLLWVRSLITIICVVGCTMLQLHCMAPKLELGMLEITIITLVSASIATATQFGLANLIGYPVPFGLVLGTPACFVVLVSSIVLPRRQLLRDKPDLRRLLGDYVTVWVCQIGLTVIYPVYNYVFSKASTLAQTGLLLLLPFLKLLNKNWISYSLRDLDDMKPELVTFNIEVFHALYLSISMQSTTTINSILIVVWIDLLQGFFSFLDVQNVLRDLEPLANKVRHQGKHIGSQEGTPGSTSKVHKPQTFIDTAVALVNLDSGVRTHKSLRFDCFLSNNNLHHVSSRPPAIYLAKATTPRHLGRMALFSYQSKSRILAVTAESQESTTDDAMNPPSTETKITPPIGGVVMGLTPGERLLFVQRTLKLLFLLEFVVLVEYAEVAVPFIFSICVHGMSVLKNHAFYPMTANKTDAEIKSMLDQVGLYAVLEFVSCVVFSLVLRWRVGISVLKLVAFVLENQFMMVQSKLVMWVFYVIQTSLYHFGADFSFAFRWLHAK